MIFNLLVSFLFRYELPDKSALCELIDSWDNRHRIGPSSRAEYERRCRRNCTRVSLGLGHKFLQLRYQLAYLVRVLSDAAELLLVEVRSNLFAQEDLRDHIADIRGTSAVLCNAITITVSLDLGVIQSRQRLSSVFPDSASVSRYFKRRMK